MSDLGQILHNRNFWHSPINKVRLKPAQVRSCWNKTGSMITNNYICQTLVRASPWIKSTFRGFKATNRLIISTQKTPNIMFTVSTVTKISSRAAFATSLLWVLSGSKSRYMSRVTAWNRHKVLILLLQWTTITANHRSHIRSKVI